MAEDWTPAFPGQRPPFQPGHELSLRHGAYSPRRVDPLARELVDLVFADDALTYLREPRFAAAVWSWARAEARVQLLDEWVSAMSLEQAANPPKPGSAAPLELLRRFEASAATHRARLGLDPVSAARLQRDLVSTSAIASHAGLASLLERGRAVLDARESDEGEADDE